MDRSGPLAFLDLEFDERHSPSIAESRKCYVRRG